MIWNDQWLIFDLNNITSQSKNEDSEEISRYWRFIQLHSYFDIFYSILVVMIWMMINFPSSSSPSSSRFNENMKRLDSLKWLCLLLNIQVMQWQEMTRLLTSQSLVSLNQLNHQHVNLSTSIDHWYWYNNNKIMISKLITIHWMNEFIIEIESTLVIDIHCDILIDWLCWWSLNDHSI
jgi:hypothetical protein